MMRIHWEVEDGYCGKSRPQYTDIDDQDLEERETEEEREELIEDAVQQDFDQRITYCITRREK